MIVDIIILMICISSLQRFCMASVCAIVYISVSDEPKVDSVLQKENHGTTG